MARVIADSVLNAALSHIQNNVNQLVLIDTAPADRTAALASALATHTVGAGDCTIANGDFSGRKLTLAAQTGISVTDTGNYNHAVLLSATEILAILEADTTRALVNGDTVNLAAFDIEVGDPA